MVIYIIKKFIIKKFNLGFQVFFTIFFIVYFFFDLLKQEKIKILYKFFLYY